MEFNYLHFRTSKYPLVISQCTNQIESVTVRVAYQYKKVLFDLGIKITIIKKD